MDWMVEAQFPEGRSQRMVAGQPNQQTVIFYTCQNRSSRREARKAQLLIRFPRWGECPARFQNHQLGKGYDQIQIHFLRSCCPDQSFTREEAWWGWVFCTPTRCWSQGTGMGRSDLGPALTVQGRQMGFQGTGVVSYHVQRGPAQLWEGGEAGLNLSLTTRSHLQGVWSGGARAILSPDTGDLFPLHNRPKPQTAHETSREGALASLWFFPLCRWRTQSSFRSYSLGEGHRVSWGSWDQFLTHYSEAQAWTIEPYLVSGKKKKKDDDGDEN